MSPSPEPRHDLSPEEIDEIEDRLHGHNGRATGHHDAQGLGFVLRDGAGAVVGVAEFDDWPEGYVNVVLCKVL